MYICISYILTCMSMFSNRKWIDFFLLIIECRSTSRRSVGIVKLLYIQSTKGQEEWMWNKQKTRLGSIQDVDEEEKKENWWKAAYSLFCPFLVMVDFIQCIALWTCWTTRNECAHVCMYFLCAASRKNYTNAS